MSRWLVALLFGATLVCSTARAQEGDDRFVYRPEWRKFGAADYIGTGVLAAGLVTLELTQSGPDTATWTSPAPYVDQPMRDAMVASGRSTRERAALYSDWMWHGLVIYPIVDVALTPLIRGGNTMAVWQMTMMNVQAFATLGLLVRIPQKWIGRSRPTVSGCEEDPEYASQCKSTIRFVSFPGGHFAAATAGAGLTCAHHLHGDLYGGGSADVIACGSTLGVASLVGYLRLHADEHWLSDQVVAGAMGLFSGYALPTLLYYRPFWRAAPKPTAKPTKSITSRAGDLGFTIVPHMTGDTLGMSLLLFESR